jgi:hypothetical protein
MFKWFQEYLPSKTNKVKDENFNLLVYCDVLPSNASVICGFWILHLDLFDKSSGGITINHNILNLVVSTLR